MRERFDVMRAMGIRTVMITGDNALTAASIAKEAGVDDFLAEATPEDKMRLIKKEQEGGRLVAMTGDGTNDAPALAQADVGVAMNSGTSAAKEAGNMVDLDSDPTKLIEVVEIGKQLLITRGALTTFSIANDIAKYFAIIPAMFVSLFPGLDALNIMRLASPESAMLSAVIFNALIILALIPLALKGVRYTPSSAAADASSQPAPLRPRRRHRPVHRHQGHRPRLSPSFPDWPDHMSSLRQLVASLRMLLVLTVLLGVLYPAVVWGIGRVGLSDQADGSLVSRDGVVVGSSLLGQNFTDPKWFHGRPSASEYCRRSQRRFQPRRHASPDQVKAVRDRQAAWSSVGDGGRAPADALTASASGLDPHVSPANALAQVSRVAAANGLDETAVRQLVDAAHAGSFPRFPR